ncbi:MAG: hypothetical protein GVY16_01800 [Planctomycetes bacterium]|nr:hypothetical protein [Planctomycetota bacterium]
MSPNVNGASWPLMTALGRWSRISRTVSVAPTFVPVRSSLLNSGSGRACIACHEVTVALDEPDVQRLGKAFRRATGLSPTDFRAAARAEVER